MDLQLRKIAAHHAKCYRSFKAYLSGFEDAQPSELFETEGHRIKAGWVTAVEMVQKRLLAADPEKAMVFSRLFHSAAVLNQNTEKPFGGDEGLLCV